MVYLGCLELIGCYRDKTIGSLRTAQLETSQELKLIQRQLQTVRAALSDKERTLAEAQGECKPAKSQVQVIC